MLPLAGRSANGTFAYERVSTVCPLQGVPQVDAQWVAPNAAPDLLGRLTWRQDGLELDLTLEDDSESDSDDEGSDGQHRAGSRGRARRLDGAGSIRGDGRISGRGNNPRGGR